MNRLFNPPVVFRRLKNPETTGENRCIPCTVLNFSIAVVGSFGVAALLVGQGAQGIVIGVGLFSVATVIIYLRGYLIPGTPTITKRYFPPWLLSLFGKVPERPHEYSDGAAMTELLRELGIVTDTDTNTDVELNPAFAVAWDQSILDYQSDDRAVQERISSLAAVPEESIKFEDGIQSYTAWADGTYVASWPSRGAVIADAAAADLLSEWDDDWSRRTLPVKAELLGILRLFLERCPTCDGSVSLSQDVVESCCQSRDVVAATCEACNSRLFEVDIDPDIFEER